MLACVSAKSLQLQILFRDQVLKKNHIYGLETWFSAGLMAGLLGGFSNSNGFVNCPVEHICFQELFLENPGALFLTGGFAHVRVQM